MAKVSASARAANRQATGATPEPAPATAPARSTRAARSQSHEPDEPQTPRRSTRNARGASVEHEGNVAAKTNPAATSTDLATVEEDLVEQDQQIDLGLDGLPTAEQEDDVDDEPSPSRASAVSGTTAKTSFSMEEVAELDSEVMLDSLKILDAATEQVMRMLVPHEPDLDLETVWNEIQNPDTKVHKRYQKCLSTFLLQKSDYTTTLDYIRPDNVSRALFEVNSVDEIPQGARRPDLVLRKANLAYMLHMLLIKATGADTSATELTDALESADDAFPRVIAGPSAYPDPSALEMSMAITTQLAINRMGWFVTNPNYDPEGIAKQAFFTEDDDGNRAYRHYFALHLDAVSVEQEAAALERIESLVNSLKEPFQSQDLDPVQAVEQLREKFPWSVFVKDYLVQYYGDLTRELGEELLTLGGIDQFDAQVKSTVANRDELKYMSNLALTLGQPSGKPKRSAAPDEIQQLRAMAEANASRAAMPQNTAPVAQMTASQQSDYMNIDQFDDPATAPPVNRDIQDLSKFQSFQQTQTRSGRNTGRGKFFNDRQPGAVRVEFESQYTQSPALPQSTLGKRSRTSDAPESSFGKRARMDEDWDPTQDGGPDDDDEAFETAPTNAAAADERRRQAPAVIQNARAEFAQTPQFTQFEGRATPQASPQRRNPGSIVPGPESLPEPTGTLERSRRYQQATYQAKQERVAQPARPARERRAWTDLETEALMTYLEEWPAEDGLHYALIKRKDSEADGLNALGERNAEDIRFRARNMKVNLLLANNGDIHPNWEKVQLGKKEIDKLRNRGIPYIQAGMRGTANNSVISQDA